MIQSFRHALLFFLCFILQFNAHGQHFTCGADSLRARFLIENPGFRQIQDHLELEWSKAQGTQTLAKPLGNGPYTIPVVVHIVHQNGIENISDAQIMDGINQLNASFANTGYYDQGNGVMTSLQFCLARQAPDGTASTGITRTLSSLTDMTMETEDLPLKNLSRWNPFHYLNIWLVRSISSDAQGPSVAGYAYFPDVHGSDFDGVVMEANFFGKNEADNCVLTHEIGHYFGLYHTFEGGCSNNNCVQDGDHVCDTPPDQSTAWLPCGTPANTCSTDTQSGFSTDQEDMTINYMDYATISCYNAFTSGQNDRMEFFLLQARSSLLESKGCLDPCPYSASAAFSASQGPVIVGQTSVDFNSLTPGLLSYEWLVDGLPVSTQPGFTYSFTSLGQHIVTLHVKGAEANCFDIQRDTFVVICAVQADFNVSDSDPIVGETVTFTSNSTGANTYEWNFNGLLEGTGGRVAKRFPGTQLLHGLSNRNRWLLQGCGL